MYEKKMELMTGIFVMLGLVILMGLIVVFGEFGHYFEKTYPIKCLFTSIEGLQVGTAVRKAGVKVGRVGGIRFLNDPEERIEVVVDVRRAVSIKRDAILRINKEGFIGEQYLEFSRGKNPKVGFLPKDGDGEIVAEAPMDVMAQIYTLFDHLNDVFANPDFKENLRKTAGNMETLTAKGTEFLGSAQEFVKSAQTTSQSTNDSVKEAKALATQLRQTVEKVEKLVNAIQAEKIARTVDAVEKTVAGVSEGHGLVGKLVADKQMENDLVTVVRELRETVTLIREHPVLWWYGPEKKSTKHWWWPFGGDEEKEAKKNADGNK